MAGVQVIVLESEVKCNAEKIYHIIKHSHDHLPTIFPESFKGAEIVEGDENKNGTIRIWNYNLPGTSEVLHVKCKNVDMDDEKMTFGLGSHRRRPLLKQLKNFVARVHVIPKGNVCLLKWSAEYEKLNESVADPHHYLEMFEKAGLKMDDHLSSQ